MPRFVRRMTLRLAYPALLSSPLVPLTFWHSISIVGLVEFLHLALIAARPAGEARPHLALQIVRNRLPFKSVLAKALGS